MKEVTKEIIEGWKQQHGDVFLVEVEDKKCYLKSPDRKTMKAAMAVVQTDPIRSNEIVLENCWIEGDAEIKTDNSLFFAVSTQLEHIVKVKQATLKKL